MSTTEMVIQIVGGLALFLFGMKIMSEGLQKVAGQRLRQTLSVMTGNRFRGVGTGVLITSAIQSSSATTVMLVSFVSAGLLTLTQSVGVIMGANIGTTVTGWLVALLGFRIKIAAMALPAIAIGFFLRFFGPRRPTDWGGVIIGFGLLFLGLDFMKNAVGVLKDSPTILDWMANANAQGFGGLLLALLVGSLVTVIIQSSSATMAITMTLAAQGMIDVPTACALILGENIGTTITANIAAIGATPSAKRTARAHFLFNVIGAVWMILLFRPFLLLVDWIVPGEALGSGVVATAAADHMAAFHTMFNLTNTALFLPLAGALAWIARRMVKTPPGGERFRLKYLDTKLVPAAPLAIQATRNELLRMLEEVESMLDRVMLLISSPDKKMGKTAEGIMASEETVDMLEKELTEYLVNVGRHSISREQSHEITGIINAVSDLERMGDHCESLLKLAQRKYDNKYTFSWHAIKDILEIGAKVKEFIELIKPHVVKPGESFMPKANQIEDLIDQMNVRMRQAHVARLNEGACDVSPGLIFIDMLTSFEKIGDHSYNIAQMLSGER
jgi:phosphate:Na+ symporter